MPNPEHLQILNQGVEQWNEWRISNPNIQADLSDAKLFFTDLKDVNLSGVNLVDSVLYDVNLMNANLSNANLERASLMGARLISANLENANLETTNLWGANLFDANLAFANLSGANLIRVSLVDTNLSNATITGCNVYGISAWNVNLAGTIQKDLIITNIHEPEITVDDLSVAQFIYLLLNNKNIRNVLNTITSKAVLILGRFSDPKRKLVLDELREKLRNLDLLPIVFDFDCPVDKDYTETVQTLAGMSMFVIVDVTNPKSTPLELEAIVKQFKIPYIPIIDISVDKRPFAMLNDLRKSFHWVLPTLMYKSMNDLLDDENIRDYIINPVIKKREELRMAKNNEPETILIRKKRVKDD